MEGKDDASGKNRLLWLSGIPGSGKSVIARVLVDEPQVMGVNSSRVCYFFFKSGTESGTLSLALYSLLHQLRPKEKQAKNQGLDILWDRFIKALPADSSTPTFCVLDAIDECDAKDREFLIDKIKLYVVDSTSCSIRFVVTGRPEQEIRTAFSRVLRIGSASRVQGEHKTGAIRDEIKIFIDTEIKELGEDLELDVPVQDALRKKIMENAQWTYLWVKLVFKELRRALNGSSKEILHIVDRMSSGIEEAYERILSQCQRKDLARKAFHLILAARRPLTIDEWNVAMAIDPKTTKQIKDLELEPASTLDAYIRNICAHLVVVEKCRVHLIHHTLREYLQETSATNETWRHSIRMDVAHEVMAEACMTALLFRENSGIFSDRHGLWVSWDFNPLVRYAAPSWEFHYQESNTDHHHPLASLATKLYQPSSTWAEMRQSPSLFWDECNKTSDIHHTDLTVDFRVNRYMFIPTAASFRPDCSPLLNAAVAGSHSAVRWMLDPTHIDNLEATSHTALAGLSLANLTLQWPCASQHI